MLRLRLINALVRHRDYWESYANLEKQIEALTSVRIGRRKLKELIEGPPGKVDVNLKLSELAALDEYLGPLGDGLSVHPFFEQPGILAGLGRNKELVFLLGSQPRKAERRIDLSRWDIRAMNSVLRSVTRYTGNVHFDFDDVLYRDAADKTPVDQEPWFQWLDRADVALVSIGSPRACRATELLLAAMLGVTPFVAPKEGNPQTPLPFYFVWPPGRRRLKSRFALAAGEVEGMDSTLVNAVSSEATGAMALVVGETIYASHQVGRAWKSYGVIVAQQRRNGQVRAVLSGLSGPATYACARLLEDVMDPLPTTQSGGRAPILWAVVEATLKSGNTPGDPREVDHQILVEDPKVWRNVL